MLIFFLSILILSGSILLVFSDKYVKKTVMVLSFFSVTIITLNLLNEIQTNLYPTASLKSYIKEQKQLQSSQSLMLKQSNSLLYFNNFQSVTVVKTIEFLNEIDSLQQTSHYQSLIRQKVSKDNKIKNEKSPSQYLKNQQAFALIQNKLPLTVQKQLLMNLEQKLASRQSSIVYIEGLSPQRVKKILASYVKDVNIRIKNNNFQSAGDLIVEVKLAVLDSGSGQLSQVQEKNKMRMGKVQYKLSPTLDSIQKNVHSYILIAYQQPYLIGQQLLDFLYQLYLQTHLDCTIIFTQLPANMNIHPISELIQTLSIDQIEQQKQYAALITDFLEQLEQQSTLGHKLETHPKGEQLLARDPTKYHSNNEQLNQIQSDLEFCQKYCHIDYHLFASVLTNNFDDKSLFQICYQKTLQPISNQIECLSKLIQSSNRSIPFNLARQCRLQGHIVGAQLDAINSSSGGIIRIRQNNSIRLRKELFWFNKVNAQQLGMVKGRQKNMKRKQCLSPQSGRESEGNKQTATQSQL